jgi:hypothetical protein
MNKKNVIVFIAVALALGPAATSPASADNGYTLTDLGFIGGTSSEFMSQAFGLNNSGVVVGETRTVSALDAFVWYGAPLMFDLPIFGSPVSQAFDVSDARDIAGWYQPPGGCCASHAFFTSGGNTVDLTPSAIFATARDGARSVRRPVLLLAGCADAAGAARSAVRLA